MAFQEYVAWRKSNQQLWFRDIQVFKCSVRSPSVVLFKLLHVCINAQVNNRLYISYIKKDFQLYYIILYIFYQTRCVFEICNSVY